MKGIVDSTLREGEQAAHVYLDLNEKLRIIELLIDVGIDEIELGIAQKNPEIKKLMKKAKKLDGCPKLGLWCRCLPHDIDETLALFPDILNLSIPVSDIHLKNRLGRDRDWIMRRVGESIRQAGNKTSCYLSLGLEDASRADTEFLEKVCLIAQEEGIDRVRFADTLGIMDPLTMANTITRLKSLLKIDIGVHTHNDFGMATANAVSALSAGADFADVTVNGLGERAGNAALEEIIAFLVKKRGMGKYRLKPLYSLSRYVAEVSHIPIYQKKPVVGEDIFTCESGIHIDGLIKDTSTYEPYDPSEVCLERKFLVGKKAGKNSLYHKLKTLGIKTESHILEALLIKVKNESSRIKMNLSDENLLHLYYSLVNG
ncbi:MAG: homoaconitate hydratase [Deltaproteobacteria bacterium]|nr:homoaconitate hydratase [Deltaproteobacteria bacterium]